MQSPCRLVYEYTCRAAGDCDFLRVAGQYTQGSDSVAAAGYCFVAVLEEVDLEEGAFAVAEGQPVRGRGERGAEEAVLGGGVQEEEGTERGGGRSALPETPAGFGETNRGCHLNIAQVANPQPATDS